jgi:hypothetical protein
MFVGEISNKWCRNPMTKAQGQLLMGFDISQGQHLVTPGLREENMIWIDMGVS